MAVVLAAACWYAGTAGAQDETRARDAYFGVGTLIERTDNVVRAETDEVYDTIYGVIADFGWDYESRRLSSSLQGNIAYYDYSSDLYETEVAGSVVGTFAVELIPDRITWLIEDTFGQARVDELEPVTDLNRQNANVFATGPRFNLPFGPLNLLTIEGTYTKTDYETSASDNESQLVRLTLSRQIRPRQTVSLNASVQDIDYAEDALYVDYEEREYYVGWAARGARTRLTTEVGYSTIERPGQGDEGESDGSLVRIELGRDVASNSELALRFRKETWSSSEAFRYSRRVGGGDWQMDPTLITAEPFRVEYAGGSYTVDGGRLEMTFDVATQKERYETSVEQNRDAEWVGLWLVSNFGASWSAGIFGEYGREKFVERDGARFDLLGVGITAGVNLTNTVRMDVMIARDERDASFANGSYTENFATLAFRYWLGERQPTRLVTPRGR